jgi:hypothetical protein
MTPRHQSEHITLLETSAEHKHRAAEHHPELELDAITKHPLAVPLQVPVPVPTPRDVPVEKVVTKVVEVRH